MSDNKINIIYNAADIERYYAGDMTAAEMHAIEKAALDDPFLSEAMEGFEAMKGKEWNTQLTALHKQFSTEPPMAKIVPLNRSTGRWWKAVAAILVIGSGTLLTYVFTKEKNTETPVQIAETKTVADQTDKKDSSPSVTTVITPNTTEKDNPIKSTSRQSQSTNNGLAQTKNTTAVADSVFMYKPPFTQPAKPLNTNTYTTTTKADDISSQVNTAVPPPPPVVNNNAVAAEAPGSRVNDSKISGNLDRDELRKKSNQGTLANSRALNLNRSFNAQVVGPDNTPLPFSNVSIKSENFGTYADVKGNFRLVSTDSILNVEVRSVGYLPRTYTLQANQSQNKIVLAEDEIAGREKTVLKGKDLSSNRSKIRTRLVPDSVENVEPRDGWDNYNTYVANNIQLPEHLLKNDVHGEIEISFDIKSNGTISNVRIDKSNCNDCEELAKRLIEQGPQWKLKKGRKASARVKVQY